MIRKQVALACRSGAPGRTKLDDQLPVLGSNAQGRPDCADLRMTGRARLVPEVSFVERKSPFGRNVHGSGSIPERHEGWVLEQPFDHE
jgi:hypothetical protein